MAAGLSLTTTCVFFMNNAAGMLPGGLVRAGVGLLGLHAYNKSPQGKAHKALAERLELEGNGDVVFLPREVLQSFGQSEAPAGGEVSSSAAGMEKALGVTDTDVVKSTKEVMIDREKYERAARENPTFRAAAEAYVRYGSEGRTFSETAADIRDNVSDPINAETPFARSARAVRDRKIQALKDAGADDRTAEAGGYIWAKSVLRRAYNLGENEFGVLRDDALTPEQLDNLNVRGGQAEEAFGGDVYGQPMNAGVNLNQEVTGVVVTPTLADDDIPLVKTSGEVRKSFFDKIAGKYLNTDTQWKIFLSKKNIDHAIHTAMDTAKKNVHNLGFTIRFEDIVKILEGLPQIVQNAKLIESHEDRHKNPDVKQIHRMYCPVKLTTDPDVYHVVKLTVKELKSGYEATIAGIYRGYDAKVEQTRKKASDVHRTPQRSDTSNTSGAFSVSIGEMLDQVKDNDGNLYFQSAWHGSPHRFESFDLGAVGSGEGGQAHGWGLYFARDKKIAEGYRAKLESEGDGALFEVDVPENDVLLDEDLPLPEQPEKVREAISKYYRSCPDDYIAVDGDSLPEQNGGLFLKEVISQLAREGEPEPKKAASLLLNSLGIKGITYDGSRDGRCFVVFDDKAVSVIERYNQEVTGQPLVRQGLTRKPDSAQAKVVRLKNVPELAGKKVKEILAWAKSILQSGGDITIRSTGQVARFTTTNINASLKRSREKLHNETYAALREMVENAEYSHSELVNTRHASRTDGQDVYTSALEIGGRLYSVRLKLDIVPEALRAQIAKERPEDVRYKDHKLTEIEIAPALYQGSSQNGLPLQEAGAIKMAPALYGTVLEKTQGRTQEAGAISTVSLGVLRGNVKPSNLEGGHLQQKRRGQIQIGPNGEGLITLFKDAGRSTFFHEMGHMMLDDLITDGLAEKANARTKADLDAVRAYLGIGDMDLSKRQAFTGGSAALILIDGQDLAEPLRLETITPGSFRGLLVYDRWQLWPDWTSAITQLGPDYGLPVYYTITDPEIYGVVPEDAPLQSNTRVHYSRLIRSSGLAAPHDRAALEQSWGLSVIERVFDRLQAFDATNEGAASLVNMAYLRTIKLDNFRNFLAGPDAMIEPVLRQMDLICKLQSINGLTVIDGKDDMQMQSYTFSGLDQVLLSFGQQLSGASDIPLTRLFGQSPAGLDSTGDSDIKTYYDGILRTQESQLRWPLQLLLEIESRNLFGVPLPRDANFTFAPLWQISDTEKSAIDTADTNAVIAAYDAGLIDEPTALRELQSRGKITGRWDAVTADVIASAEAGPPVMEIAVPPAKHDSGFDESDHPRGEDGKFANGGGKSKGTRETKKQTEVVLGKKEYAVIMSTINAQYKAKFQGRVGKTCGVFHGIFIISF